jgi:K+-transporting ATPase ATPase C chain
MSLTQPASPDPDSPRPSSGPALKGVFGGQLRPALLSLLWLTTITGVVFPLVLFVSGRAMFPAQADGGLILDHGVIVGSRPIGQAFHRPGYFQTRPSAAGAGYDATASGGSNQSPTNPRFARDVAQFAAAYRKDNGLAASTPIPIDAVTRSASGLDPQISPANAALQVPRVARARGLGEAAVRRLVDAHTEGRQLGFLGEPRVSVLALNLALDREATPHAR